MDDLLEDKVYTNSDLCRMFGCSNIGGIRYVKGKNLIVLINNLVLSQSLNPYKNRWEDGILIYTGEGLEGNQTLTGGNDRLLKAKVARTEIYYFEVYKNGEYTYKGKLKRPNTLWNEKEKQLDKNGQLRSVLTFELKK